MRYIDRVVFITETEGGFNPDTGNHDEPIEHSEIKPCHISTIGVERSARLFGEIDTSVIVVRLQRPYNKPIDRVEIPNGQYKGEYRLKERIPHRTESVFYLEGVQ